MVARKCGIKRGTIGVYKITNRINGKSAYGYKFKYGEPVETSP